MCGSGLTFGGGGVSIFNNTHSVKSTNLTEPSHPVNPLNVIRVRFILSYFIIKKGCPVYQRHPVCANITEISCFSPPKARSDHIEKLTPSIHISVMQYVA